MPKNTKENQLEVDSLVSLLQQQDPRIQDLFSKALNIFASPDARKSSPEEKEEQLRQAIEKSVQPHA
jgi:flagellar basal body-associated protein FliL